MSPSEAEPKLTTNLIHFHHRAGGSGGWSALGALASKLRTFQQQACDNQQLVIRCPSNFSIDVINASYSLLEPNEIAHKCARPASSLSSLSAPPRPEAQVSACELDESKLERQVKNVCQSMNSCSLELKWPEQGNSSSPAALELARHLVSACPTRRKLLELVYRCRPERFSRRYVCAARATQFECPPDRQLVIAAADFGAQRDELRGHESCGAKQSLLTASRPACWANSSKVFASIQASCAGKRTCDLQVSSAALGDTGCPSGQAEYLRVLHVCILDRLLLGSPAHLGVASAAPDPDPLATREESQEAARADDRLHELITSNPRLSSEPASAWSGAQRVRFLLAAYRLEASLVGCAALGLVLAGALVGACRSNRNRKGARHLHSGSCASSSSGSSSSSAGFVRAEGAGKAGALQAGAKQLNSCSESCFSLDDYQLPGLAGTLGSTPGASPGLDGLDACSALGPRGSAKPRLWSVYGHEQVRGQQQTLRAPRTFVGPPQLAGPASSRPLCAAHAGNELLLAAVANQQHLAGWAPLAEPLAPLGLLPADPCAFHAQFASQPGGPACPALAKTAPTGFGGGS